MILLIGSVNAINWDNGISYKDNDMIVEFENGYFFGLGEWLGFSEKLGEAELTSHKTITEVRNVMSGVNRTTMYYDFNDWEIYPDGLGDVFFTDMRTGKEVKKDYYFAKAIYKDQERIVYNQECSQRLSGNGTQENYDCKKILVINETEKIIVGWERLLTNDIPKGNNTIGLVTDVNKGDYIDGIWTITGKKVIKHASWNDGYHDNLVAYYNFSGSSTADIYTGVHNGTISGDINFKSGISGNALNGTYVGGGGGGGKVTLSNMAGLSMNNSEEYSVSMWLYYYGGNFGWTLSSANNPTSVANPQMDFNIVNNGGLRPAIRVRNNAGADSELVGGNDFPLNRWVNVVRYYSGDGNASNYKIYVDGVLQPGTTFGTPFTPDGILPANQFLMSGGGYYSFGGKMDEIALWKDREITASEVLDLNNTMFFEVYIPDSSPDVTLNNPANDTNQITNDLTFNCSATDDVGILNLSLIINDVINYTVNNASANVNLSLETTLSFEDNNYNWSCSSSDTLSQEGTTETRIFSINTTPNIQYENPTPVNYTNLSTNSFDVNISLTETYFNNITFNLFNSSGFNINSTVYTDTTRLINWSVGSGTYTYNVTIWTNTSQSNTTETRTINIDTITPDVGIPYPSNGSSFVTFTTPYNVTLNFTASDLSLANCWYNNGTANISLACGTNTSILLGSGYHNITYYANDSVGNENNTISTFFINYIVENVTYDNPVIEGENQTITLNITATEITQFNGTLIYNGTTYNTTTSSYNSTYGTLSTTLLTPSVNLTDLKVFYWNYTLNNISYNSSTYNQTINFINISVATSCSAGLSPSMYWDFKVEENLTAVTAGIDYNFKFGITNSSYKEIYGSLDNISGFYLCVNSTIYNNYSLGYGEIQYEKIGYTDRRFYTFTTQRLTNTTINNTLYFLINADATSFLFEFKDTALTPYINKFSSLLRWYPDLNQYINVEMAKTDDKGATIMRVKVEDVDYRVGLYQQNGTIIKLLSPVRFACLTSPCSYSTLIEETPNDYTSFFGVETSIFYNETSEIWAYTWNDPSQNTDNMSFKVTRDRGDQTFTICDNSATGFTGVLTCDSSGYTGTLRGVAYRTASPVSPIAQKIINTGTTIFAGSIGLFISFIIFLALALIGSYSPVVSVILGIVGLFPAYIFGSITLPIFIAIGVIGGLVIHFMKRTG
jgi:hypothetical protein|tara:strand:+ start:947 stop:4495 length:3549 start_codon:yes stop_codon:yes gene_type:complete